MISAMVIMGRHRVRLETKDGAPGKVSVSVSEIGGLVLYRGVHRLSAMQSMGLSQFEAWARALVAEHG